MITTIAPIAMIQTGGAIALASAAAILAGLPLVAPARRPGAGDLAAAWTLALGIAAVLALAAGLLGLALSPPVLLLFLLAPGALAIRWRPHRSLPAVGQPGAGGPLLLVSRLALACALAVLAVKLLRTPLWSWDHYAIWGVKARWMLAGDHLRLDFLRSLYATRADHPLGLPMVWLLLTLGRAPGPAAFKALHALAALALVAVTRTAVHRAGASPPLANAAAALLAASPPLWDTETMGLAEVPLALWAMTGLLLALPAAGSPRPRSWVPALAVGFLPWIKQEGLPLGLLLLLLLLLAARRAAAAEAGGAGAATAPGSGPQTRLTALAMTSTGSTGSPISQIPTISMISGVSGLSGVSRISAISAAAIVPMAGAIAVQRCILPRGDSFFRGDWWQRGLERLPHSPAILRQCLAFLSLPDWLGFWFVLAALTVLAAALRRGAALAVLAIVWTQVVLYQLTALFTYLPPAAHLDAAFFRICGPLVPIGLLGMALLVRETNDESRANRRDLRDLRQLRELRVSASSERSDGSELRRVLVVPQQVDHLRVGLGPGGLQRGDAVVAGQAGVGAVLQEDLGQVEVARLDGGEQGGRAVLVLEVDLRPGVEE